MARRIVLVLSLLVAAAGGCGDDDGGGADGGSGAEVEGLPTVDGAPEAVVVGTDFSFEPAVLHLVAGQPVNIVFESAQGGHNLVVLPDLFQLPIIDEGESTRGALTIDDAGTYELVCTVPGHIDEGMVGTVEVTAVE